MSTAIALHKEFNREQVDLIKRTIAKGSTDDELAMFVQTSQRLGLDPFARQVFAVKRWDSREKREVMSIQVSIDGFRLVAERTGKYAGQLGPFWSSDGKEWLEVWLAKTPPAAAKVAVLRHDFKEPVWAVATWEQYKQTTRDGGVTSMWAKMGPLMLAKCAESLALRRAFPNELSGVYSAEEMAQATTVEVVADEGPKETTHAAPVAAHFDSAQSSSTTSARTATTSPAASASGPAVGGTAGPVAAKAAKANTIPHDGTKPTPKQIAYLHTLKTTAGLPDCDGSCVKETQKYMKSAGGLVPSVVRCAYHTQLAAFRDQQGNRITTSKDLAIPQISNLIERYEAKVAKEPPRPLDLSSMPDPPDELAKLRAEIQAKQADGDESLELDLLEVFRIPRMSDLPTQLVDKALALTLAWKTGAYSITRERVVAMLGQLV
jgi:phage recombination protein Bet